MWTIKLPQITKIPPFECDKSKIENFFQMLESKPMQAFLNIDDLQTLEYGEYMYSGIDTFRPLKLYDNLPSTFNGMLQTILEMRRDFPTSAKLICVADIAFFKNWWQALPFLEEKHTYGKLTFKLHSMSHGSMTAYSNVTFIWGNFHCWLKALGYCWDTWQDVTRWLFDIIFPNVPWWKTPTTANLIQFYNHIFQHVEDLLYQIALFNMDKELSPSDIHALSRIRDFLQNVVPTLHYYYYALRRNNNETFQKLQWQLFKIIMFCNANEYKKCFVFNYFLLHNWRNTPMQELFNRHWELNEEIGESSLSILARSTSSCPQNSKTAKLKENLVLISHMHQLQKSYQMTSESNISLKEPFIEEIFLERFQQALKHLPSQVTDIQRNENHFLKDFNYFTQLKLIFDSIYKSWILPSQYIQNPPNSALNNLLLEKIWSTFG